jgi:hypothetical protein
MINDMQFKETEEKTVNLISVNFPSAFCMLIRYEIINTGHKYEIVMQGDYQDQYRAWKESEEKEIPEAVKVEWIIKDKHGNAKLVSIKK